LVTGLFPIVILLGRKCGDLSTGLYLFTTPVLSYHRRSPFRYLILLLKVCPASPVVVVRKQRAGSSSPAFAFRSERWNMDEFSRISVTWDLVKTSLALLRSDAELIVLPILSTLSSALAFAAFFGCYVSAYGYDIHIVHLGRRAFVTSPHPAQLYFAMFLYYVANFFVVIFCNVALVGVANSRMCGGTWTLSDGLSLAWARRLTILKWATFAATIGVILNCLEERAGFLGRIAIGLIGMLWTLACFFVVPVLAFEDLSPLDALKRSAALFRKTWGENVVAGISFGVLFSIPLIGGFALWFFAVQSLPRTAFIPSLIVLALYIQLMVATMSAASSIFNLALYRYALTGKEHGGFSSDQFASAWVPKL